MQFFPEISKSRMIDRNMTAAQPPASIAWLLSLIALSLLIAGLYLILQPFIVPIAWAMIFVLVTWPLRQWLFQKMPRHPNFCALLMTLVLALIVALAILPLFAALSNELMSAIVYLERWLSVGSIPIPAELRKLPWVGSIIEQDKLDIRVPGDVLLELLSGYRSQILEVITVAAQGFFSFLGKSILCLITAFFLYRGGGVVGNELGRGLFRIGGERFHYLLTTFTSTLRVGVAGMLLTAVVQGVLAGMGYLVAGTPVPILLGCLTMVLALIPFGTPLVYLPAAILVVLNGAAWWVGALLALWGVGVVSSADNICRTIFISQTTEMPLPLALFGVLGGILAFGLIGILIGPAILALAHILWLEWCETPQT